MIHYEAGNDWRLAEWKLAGWDLFDLYENPRWFHAWQPKEDTTDGEFALADDAWWWFRSGCGPMSASMWTDDPSTNLEWAIIARIHDRSPLDIDQEAICSYWNQDYLGEPHPGPDAPILAWAMSGLRDEQILRYWHAGFTLEEATAIGATPPADEALQTLAGLLGICPVLTPIQRHTGKGSTP